MTQIFKDYSEFRQREDKAINGVSPGFAEENENWEQGNISNEGCWCCSGCSDCADCSGCYRCSGCSDCSRCSRCSDCSDCADLNNKHEVKQVITIPIIDNIHQKILEAVQQPDALNMSEWHTCDTTHCRAGWVSFLAGPAGKELEKQTCTEFAAMQIYKASSPIMVSPVRFYESNEVAMADIIRCAKEEATLVQ